MQRIIIILSVLVLSVGLIAKNIVSDFKGEVSALLCIYLRFGRLLWMTAIDDIICG